MRDRAFGRYLTAAVWFGLIYLLAKPKENRSGHADEGSKKTEIEPEDRSPLRISLVNEGWHAEEKEHRKQEKKYWRKSLSFSVFAVIIAAIAAGAAGGAFYQAQRQADAAEKGNRPWVKLTGAITIPRFQIRDGKASFGLIVEAENVGNSPAQDVILKLGGPKKSEFHIDQRAYCFADSAPAEVWNTRTIFPKDREQLFGAKVDVPVSSLAGERVMYISGCMFYRSDSLWRITYFEYGVTLANGAPIDLTANKIYAGSELAFSRNHSVAYAD